MTLVDQITRFRNGLRFGTVFIRNKWFSIPKCITVAGRTVKLSYPDEAGVRNDFLACVIRNDYGVGLHFDALTILDIGANVGFFSLAARNAYPNAVIHAYEPNPRILPYLRANTIETGVKVYAESVGSEAGHVAINDHGDSNLTTTTICEHGQTPQVSFATAISRLGGSVDFLKLDCEGAEWDLFNDEESWTSVKATRMEYHLGPGQTVSQVKERLRHLGFAIILHEPSVDCGLMWAKNSRGAAPTTTKKNNEAGRLQAS
jgi:FkbM family methyltransferase